MKIPTTLEMDKLIDDRDVQDRHFVMKPCIKCFQFTKQDVREANKPCVYCGGEMGIASTYWYSLRTFKIGKKFSATEKKKMGA